MRELKTYVGRDLVGTLREDNNLWVFEYHPAWSAHPQGFDLSPALPRSTPEHRDGASHRPVQWYFDNLLPEEDLRRIAAKDAGLKDHEDAFALLEYLGAESAGSLTLLAAGAPLPTHSALQPLSHEGLSQRIQDLPKSSLTRQAPKRMSIAGAQHKLLVVQKGTDLYEPIGATASTHILKPDHPDTDTYPASTFLEWFTMRMAEAAGLQVPAFVILNVPEPVYIVERFDRRIEPSTLGPATGMSPPAVQRLHVIDACQLLNKSRLFKHSGASVEALREACERVGDTLTLPLRILRWLAFNLLVANDDCHLKNLSFLVQPDMLSLAPHYDLLATGVYHTKAVAGPEGRWPDVEMAVRLSADVRHFISVTPEAVFGAADTLGIPRPAALRIVRDVRTRVFRFFDKVYAQHFPEEPGLLHNETLSPEEPDELAAVDESAIEADRRDTAQPPAQLALERRILRVLRYLILPEMNQRLPS